MADLDADGTKGVVGTVVLEVECSADTVFCLCGIEGFGAEACLLAFFSA